MAAVLEANALDIADGRAKGLSAALLDRLLLTEPRVAGLAADSRQVANCPIRSAVSSKGGCCPMACA